MERYSALRRQFPAFYNHLVLRWQLKRLGWSTQRAAREAGLPVVNVRNALLGKAKNHTVYPLCMTLGLDWLKIHDLNLKDPIDFHLALPISNGHGSQKAR